MRKTLLLSTMLVPLVTANAFAQCANGLLSNCPPAVNPQPTDVLYGWQFGQNPHSRAFPISQIPQVNLTFDNIVTGLGYTPAPNTLNGITTSLGFTPPPNTFNGITTSLGYVPGGVNSNAINCTASMALSTCAALVPSGGGHIILQANYTYVQSADLTISTPNTIIECPSWNTVIQRGTTLTGGLLVLSGSGDAIVNCTIDGNGVANTVNSNGDLIINGPNGLAVHNQVINSRQIGINLSGAHTRATGNYVVGLGTSSLSSYGIWAIGGNTVTIDHNTVTATGIDGIGFNGNGSIVDSNVVYNCHCVTGVGGGQIASYNNSANFNEVIVNNYVSTGCANVSIGLEINTQNGIVSGNQIYAQKWHGISLDNGAGSTTFIANVSINNGQAGGLVGAAAGMNVNPNVTGIHVIGGEYGDTQAVPTQTYGINFQAGTGNYLSVTGADLRGDTVSVLIDGASGTHKFFSQNVGIDDVVGSVTAATTTSMILNPTINLTGNATVTTLNGEEWIGRQVVMLPSGTVVFVSGATIANNFTTAPGVPVVAIYNGTTWSLK
jgi:hypothetical protein